MSMKKYLAMITGSLLVSSSAMAVSDNTITFQGEVSWICPYISRHLLSLNPLQARCRRYSRGER